MEEKSAIRNSLKKLLPEKPEDLLSIISENTVIENSVLSLIDEAVQNLYHGNDTKALDLCEPLLDKVWEELNTGYWKDVPMCWRQVYSLVSVIKALSESALLSDSSRNIDHMTILKTCDMGLLMGAPILNNILARMSREFQEAFGILGKWKREKTDEDSLDFTQEKKQKCEDPKTTNDSSERKDETASDFISLPPPIKTQKTREVPRCSCPSVEMFQAMFHDPRHPVIITDAIGYWPALTTRKWSIDYLRSVAGCRTVPVEIGARYTEDSWTQKLITINELIDIYMKNANSETKAYLAQHQLFDQVWELRDDISVPVYCCLGDDEDVDINAWFGPAGTISPLHQDPKHNFLCQVMGEKHVRLYSDEHTDSMYPHQSHLLHNTSQIDLDHPDLDQFPKFSNLPCLECTLRPGDMLYIPPYHWHYVKSLSVSFSVSFWWQ
ncbi:lysine-specific demethylase 8 [Biomphalaria glabrata]|uniref:JmjC domain-containing protein 5 n=1 Tax=Biomphalaria glabrata TaxID=6526 RepID=A0A9W3AZD3_BIOGL|nr:bifunctional peptidase and arginyl-hydroxylase JMJD5-like [Biomphalaria glabrata]XP_055892575.1 bifunctional peptidase and arginyl-hydroxylase JMJD5-like [Biomphalaria glabrata]XP_055892576.1 bifunctional peptidase and arginyl-hydroxylase JMJD5-like [Biomphalaria glabrata]XP_055892577.1 bifunctional peptidase and arginyl-hydroxylase JMJD5-like [Biomphalaria glabrata]XP_055892578.1 bifunctional peptidase and arginyl-hydroxylase JMJD5-like [Biomphalaria glabrata]KAI8763855.1 lysine-specific d